jgi:hypothetical protein
MDMTEGSEMSAKLNLVPRKYPKENIHCKNVIRNGLWEVFSVVEPGK